MAKVIVVAHDEFERNLDRLEHRYPGAVDEVATLIDVLSSGERPGDRLQGVKALVYKVRLRNPAAQRGKSGGFRVIYYVQLADRVVLLTIYSKTDQDDIAPEKIRQLVESLLPPA